jgi:hypothetical protein
VGTSFAGGPWMASPQSLEKIFLAHVLLTGLLTASVACGSASPLKPDGGTTGKTAESGRDGATEVAIGLQGSGGTSGAAGLGGANGTAGARVDGGADALAACTWPASLDSQDAGAGACQPAHALLSCTDGNVTELCLSDDPTRCPGVSALPGVTVDNCHDLCDPQEFAVVCGSVGPGPTNDPPAGCHGAEATPAGIVFYCCPCGGAVAGGHDGGGTEVAAGRAPQNHRANNAQCLGVAPPSDSSCPALAGAPASDCETDSQCASGSNGRCESNGGGPAGCHCSYDTCTDDDACKTGGPCVCHGSAYLRGGNVCATGNCQIDADCGAGGFCSPSLSPTSCFGLAGYYCHTPNDQCVDDADCAAGNGTQCMYDVGARRWQCQQTMTFVCPA